MGAVTIAGVGKRFGGTQILDDVSVDIAEGEFISLVGPSGCGKSTLLRIVAGLETISDGEIWISGRKVNGLTPRERDIAMVFQSYAPYPHMTVAENLSFGLSLQKESAASIRSKVADAAAILGLEELLHRYPRQLSGGQRQRVAMGRAIVRKPAVFLFDEPLSNLDANLRVSMRSEIKALHQRLGTTTIYVTHDQVEAMTMADRVVIMRAGRVEQSGPPLELYDKPANVFVAQFVGSPSMSILEGEVSGDSFQIVGGPAVLLPRHGVGQVSFLGIRPEDLDVVSPGIQGAIPAVVDVIEPMGSETQIVLTIGFARVVALLRRRVSILPGEAVGLILPVDRTHVFDPEGRRTWH